MAEKNQSVADFYVGFRYGVLSLKSRDRLFCMEGFGLGAGRWKENIREGFQVKGKDIWGNRWDASGVLF